ncbi:Sucraseferredoxin-like protein [Suillus clintonianus]|uniref:Sucraseferredoxin-like protein n=1 Tax=Suillus clintonianus TaxID=1904413 RepID=UPI001B86DBCD|nr:Sucraseferredoxin-like protein [Suillus clintonianus]KAG2125654.1 Sucraseferredoxin-like protein [Suillus clintonianus]
MPTFRALKTLVRSLSTTARSAPELVGTAPPHKCYIFLHTPQPPSEYPAKYATPVQRALLLRTAKWGGSVNFAWSEDQQSVRAPPPGEEDKQEYHLTAFTHPRGKLEARVSMDNIEEVGEQLRVHAELEGVSSTTFPDSDDVHLYICTHGARDCRCGDMGGAVAQAIRDELRKRRDADPSDPSTCIKLAEVAHVGGHKYAANLLVYPHGEWYV